MKKNILLPLLLPCSWVYADDLETTALDEIIVSASQERSDDTMMPAKVLSGDALRMKTAHSIGEP